MNKNDALGLLAASNRTVGDVEDHDPKLFAVLRGAALDRAWQRVTAGLADAPAELGARLDGLKLRDAALADLPREIAKALGKRLAAELAVEATRRLSRLERAGVFVDPLADRAVALGDLPFLRGALEEAKLWVVGELARLDDAKVRKLAERRPALTEIDDDVLARMVDAGDLRDAEARELGLVTSLYRLLGEDRALTAAVRGARVGGRAVTSVRDLAALDARAFEDLLRRANITPPAGLDRGALARALARRVAAMYPTDAFLRRLPTDASLPRLSEMYPGLGLAAVLADGALTPEARAALVSRRIGLLGAVAARHPDEDLLALDYGPDAEPVTALDLGVLGMSAEEQRMVLSTLKAYQRVHALTDDIGDAHALLASGIASATSAATLSLDDFEAATGFDEATARRYHARARAALGETTAMAASAMDVVRGGFDAIRVSNVAPDAKDVLRRLDGFAELFGSQDACECEECRSILGPAAYFVDLMAFVDEHVRERFFTGDLAAHPLNLRSRRPDLWRLPLTCENTTALVPTLEIANEVLENHVARDAATKLGTTVDIGRRAEVVSLVYERTLARAAGSFQQPFVLPLERLTAYLRHFGLARREIAGALGAPERHTARVELGLGVIEHHAITSANAGAAALRALYDLPFEVLPSTGTPGDIAAFQAGSEAVAPVEVKELLRAMGVSRAELADILEARFVQAGAGTPRIVTGKRAPESVQNDVERVHGLTLDTLDRVHRFARLQRGIAWSIGELDLVLATLGDAALDAAALGRVAAVRRASRVLGASIEETCALFGDIPEAPVTAGGVALVDRLFQEPGAAGRDLPAPTRKFLHPSLRLAGSSAAPDAALPRLLAALRVSDDDLLLLVTEHLRPALGVDPESPSEEGRAFAPDARGVALLYRHARLAERLALTIPQLFQLVGLVDSIAGGAVDSLDDLTALLDLHAWWKESGYTLDDLAVILGRPVLDASRYARAPEVAAQILADASASGALVFADTVFASALGVTEEDSRQILANNAASFVRLEDPGERVDGAGRVRLSDDFDPEAPIALPAGLAIDPDRARAVLCDHHAVAVVPSRLSAALQIPADKAAALLRLLPGRPLLGPGMARALRATDASAPEAQPLVALIAALLPPAVLFRDRAFDAAAIDLVREHGAAFGISAPLDPSLAGVRALSAWARLAPAAPGVQFTGDRPPVDAADLSRALVDFDLGSAIADEALARVLGTTTPTIASLRAVVAPHPVPVLAIERLARCVALAAQLGVGGQALADAVAVGTTGGTLIERAAAEYTALDRAAGAVLGALQARFADPAARDEALAPDEDRLRSRRRDALTDYLIHTHQPAFADRRAIYEHFLLDVDLEGCARTSRVVSATSSVQLYFQRCLMGLERTADGSEHPIHVTITDEDTVNEWGWRRAYRVWQANRKVFLYPESYLEPDLRDDKTPLFEALEAELLQKQIDRQSVLDAYTSYTCGFEEIAGLTIAGAYQDEATRTLHLLGVTASDPPRYHYRAVERRTVVRASGASTRGSVWHPWREIGVQIPVRHAAPVVYQGRLHVFWVEIRTQPVNEVEDGSSTFKGYRHKLALKVTSLRLDGKWTAPQEILLPKDKVWGEGMRGAVTDYLGFQDPVNPLEMTTRLGLEATASPVDDYTLSGASWEVAYPEVLGDDLLIVLRNARLIARVDLLRRTAEPLPGVAVDVAHEIAPREHQRSLLRTKAKGGHRELHHGQPTSWYAAPNAFANLALEDERVAMFAREEPSVAGRAQIEAAIHPSEDRLANLPRAAQVLAISGSIQDAIVQDGADAILVKCTRGEPIRYQLERLGTTLGEQVSRRLFERGVDGLLQLAHQRSLKEASPRFTQIDARLDAATNAGKLDFKGPLGAYYREIFFHIPCLVADHLNGQGQFALAQRWYHHIFNPTAAGEGVDRVWRYLELRDQTWPALRDILSNEAAIRAYEADPLNPHAIARLRLSAYAKSVAMKYLDNLLDWGDRRFAEHTMESVQEATMLYAMAADILGPRPSEVGDCGEASEALTFERIQPSLGDGSAFLVELESYAAGKRARASALRSAPAPRYVASPEALRAAITEVPLAALPAAVGASGDDARGGPAWRNTAKVGWMGQRTAGPAGRGAISLGDAAPEPITISPSAFGWSLFRQIGPAFCVPPNEDLLAYWDRVEDRLHKIHNCLDIDGQRRDLPLFAPALDPRLLVQMKAAGLSLEEVSGAASGDLPPYRFVYLIEKAKAFASALRDLGAALLSALEKRDVEELARLRLVHEQNLAKMSTALRRWEIDAAEEAIQATRKQREAAELRRDHYRGLLDRGQSPWELTAQIARHSASTIYTTEAAIQMLATIVGLLPQVGSPFAMKYGGVELHASLASFASTIDAMAQVAEAVAASTGLEAGFDRRREDWKHQRDLADREVQQLDRQLAAAEIHKQIAEKSLAVHEKAIEQTEEAHAFHADKLTSFGLYQWMSTTLQRSYRQAYASALSLARLCQAAFAFERGDAPGLAPGLGAWDGAHAGLLAGDRLLADLEALERRFIETNYRTLEIDQSFSLTQIDPAALLRLRETGECQFTIPEIAFDLAYPGHYRRRIKAARLTIPCVTGPYTNVGATLTLVESRVRTSPAPTGSPAPVPPQRTVSIATSKAQNDAGVFELRFQDERYMPFEGAGAVSTWKLELPKSFRPFDYQTISDVVLSLAYTALASDTLRALIEQENAALEGTILEYLSHHAAGRIVSLRQELPVAYKALLNSPPGTPVAFEIKDWHFPAFLSGPGRSIEVQRARLVVKTASGASAEGLRLLLDGEAVEGFAAEASLGGLAAREIAGAFRGAVKGAHQIAVAAPGGLAAEEGSSAALDPRKVVDVMVAVEYVIVRS